MNIIVMTLVVSVVGVALVAIAAFMVDTHADRRETHDR